MPPLPASQSFGLSTEDHEFHGLVRQAVEPGILLVTAEGRLDGWNTATLRVIGPGAIFESGDPVERLPMPLSNLLRQSLEKDCVISGKTLTLDRSDPDGRRRVLWLNTFKTSGSGATPGWVVATLHDLGAARDLEHLTVRLQRLANLGLLSAGVAHEVKNAMVAVKTYAELMLEKQPDAEAAVLVRREVGRIDSLIGHLLQVANPAVASPAVISVHEVLTHALRLAQHPIQERGLEEVVLFEAPVDTVLGDGKQLEQAFLNLLFNAVEASPPKARLVVRTEVVVATEHVSKFEAGRRREQLQVEIRDFGPGLAAEVMDRLFTPFVTTKPGGTGLGLPITRRIILEHQGRISVETKPGEGTAFRVLLPLVQKRDSGT